MGTSFIDYDNDGQLDLFVVNGSTFQDDKIRTRSGADEKSPVLAEESARRILRSWRSKWRAVSRSACRSGAAFADYDNDGDLDVFIVNQEGRPQLLRNDGGNKRNWIKVRVKCTKSNRTGFGTKVEIEAGGITQSQEIGGTDFVHVTEFPGGSLRLKYGKRSKPRYRDFPQRHCPDHRPHFRQPDSYGD